MTKELQDALHMFYESFFPIPSQFERANCITRDDSLLDKTLRKNNEEPSQSLRWIVISFLFIGVVILCYLVFF